VRVQIPDFFVYLVLETTSVTRISFHLQNCEEGHL